MLTWNVTSKTSRSVLVVSAMALSLSAIAHDTWLDVNSTEVRLRQAVSSLSEIQFRPNEMDRDDKGVSAPHAGIGHSTMCDGSVGAISENIDAGVDNGLGTRSGGEFVGEF